MSSSNRNNKFNAAVSLQSISVFVTSMMICATCCLASHQSSSSRLDWIKDDDEMFKGNGSAILEDLVNQFIEKTKEAVKQGKEQVDFDEAGLINNRTNVTLPSSIVQHFNNPELYSSQTPEMISNNSPQFVQVFQVSTKQPTDLRNSSINGDYSNPGTHIIQQSHNYNHNNHDQYHHHLIEDPQSVEIDDRHIPYDFVQSSFVLPPLKQQMELDEPAKSSNYKLMLNDTPELMAEPVTYATVFITDSNTSNSNTLTNLLELDSENNPLEPESKFELESGLSMPNGNNSTRSSSSRSMSLNSRASIMQHSKAPYASYHQLSHRSEPVASRPISSDQILSLKLDNAPSKSTLVERSAANPNITSNDQEPTSRTNDASPSPPPSSSDEVATLVDSIHRISSHLSTDETGTKQNFNEFSTTNKQPQEQTMDDKQLQKLASSISQLVELNPIPITQQKPPTMNLDSSTTAIPMKSIDTEKSVYYSKIAHEFKNGIINNSSKVPGSLNSLNSNLQHEETLDPIGEHQMFNSIEASRNVGMFSDTSDQFSQSHHGNSNSSSNNDIFSSQRINQQTASSTSGHHPQHLLHMQQQQQQQPHHHQHEHHHAASLINITAPMTPPMSATEAMESTLADQLAKNALIHQASGLFNSNRSQFVSHSIATSSQAIPSSIGTNINQNQKPTSSMAISLSRPNLQQQQYFLPQADSSKPIYSQPANFLSLKASLNDPIMIANDIGLAGASNTSERDRMRLEASGLGRPLSINMSNYQQASGFRSPLQLQQQQQQQPQQQQSNQHNHNQNQNSHHHHYNHHHSQQQQTQQSFSSWPMLNFPVPYLNAAFGSSTQAPPLATTNSPQPTNFVVNSTGSSSTVTALSTAPPVTLSALGSSPAVSTATTTSISPTSTSPSTNIQTKQPGSNSSVANSTVASANGFITGTVSSESGPNSSAASINRRVLNLTRVEHISAECSNDLIRTVIIFNGTFKGIIYSSGYVREPNCLYINGTGKTRYDFSIRLNQCGTLGKQELHPPSGPNEIRRRDQVMWNTLSIQYNPIIEQEWDEHFRVSCEYGSDFWKTVSFSPFNVETNTGSPVVFTVDPPQCQMEILRGHGMVGPRQEAISSPVTVGDPLTLLIHMRSEKAGYDILVKNCIAHNGGHQKMQLIDSNGCVVNERFISPFRGTYNDNDLKHVTLYSYLKAFRFTGSPVLYIECEVHMCQSSCPPQMCYWRRLSKRSTDLSNSTSFLDATSYKDDEDNNSDWFTDSQATQRQTKSDEPNNVAIFSSDGRQNAKQNQTDVNESRTRYREARKLQLDNKKGATSGSTGGSGQPREADLSDRLSLSQALVVLETTADGARQQLYLADQSTQNAQNDQDQDQENSELHQSLCYPKTQVLVFLFTVGSVLLAALGLSIGCCWRAATISNLRNQERRKLYYLGAII